jgi:hypothetical protein
MVALDQLIRRGYGPRELRGGAGLICRLCVACASKIVPKKAQYQFLTGFLNQRLTKTG